MKKLLLNRPRQKGFAIVSAIFLLIVLALLGAFMVTFSTVQQTTSTQDLQGARAYHAARAGIEWGVFQVRNPENTNGTVAPFTTQYTCPAGPQVFNAMGGTLAGYTTTVQCAQSGDAVEGAHVIRHFQFTSTATSGVAGSATYVERQLSAGVATCRQTANGASCSSAE